jgi:uncharacterized protein (DUF305 family)
MISNIERSQTLRAGLVLALLLALAAGTTESAMSEDLRHAAFAAENRAAMDKMMVAMHAASTGDVDRDFAASMIPHHQGATDMATAELKHGSNEQLRRIAQEIIVEQQQEIEAMHRAVHDSKKP